ncbi:MAG: HAD-IB family phosphatase [Patescibacteria group bacterium]|jgi:D-3-phosphoglycerate dehydrogenase
MPNKYLIIDFDSTLVQIECLDELFFLTLKNNPEREKIMREFSEITNLGMEGKLNFGESLKRRMAILKAGKKELDEFITILRGHITESFWRNRGYLKERAENIFVFSGGFNDYVMPVARELGLRPENCRANTFIFDKEGNITGYDQSNFLSQTGGKIKQLKALGLKGGIYAIGDGWTDYEMKESGAADKFIVFTENAGRKSVIDKADFTAENFEEVIGYLEREKLGAQ